MLSNLRKGLLHYVKIGSFTRSSIRGMSLLVPGRSRADLSVPTRISLRHSKLFTIPGSVRLLSSGTDSKGFLRQTLWKVLRVLFLVTGGAVWSMPVVLYVGFKTGLIKVEVEEQEDSEHNRHDERLFSVFDVSKDAEYESRAREISDKSSALLKIWNKLKLEDGVLRTFGEPVDLIGYRGKCSACGLSDQYHQYNLAKQLKSSDEVIIQDPEIMDEKKMDEKKMDEKKMDENRNKNESGMVGWCVSCIVAGPKQTGILDLEFSKVNKEWIPVSLHLEGLQKTGDVVCNVSGPLPNGVTRFIRLSND